MQQFYEQYAQHAMRRYSNFKTVHGTDNTPDFFSQADCDNWSACESALKVIEGGKRDVLIDLFSYSLGMSKSDYLCERIQIASDKYDVPVNVLWGWVHDFNRKFAVVRGLI